MADEKDIKQKIQPITRGFNGFSGVDMTVSQGGKTVGVLQGITYSRDKNLIDGSAVFALLHGFDGTNFNGELPFQAPIVKKPEDEHEGMIYNEYTGEWVWL